MCQVLSKAEYLPAIYNTSTYVHRIINRKQFQIQKKNNFIWLHIMESILEHCTIKKKNDASFEFCSTLPEKEEMKKSKDKKSDHYPLKKILSSPNTELVETEK